ncbi:EAL domain-containing protein [Endozoicomonas montiporae]|nr:EAL domain-containing protein [Endozoicomonas montiporae]
MAVRACNIQTPEELEEALKQDSWSLCLTEESVSSLTAEQLLQTLSRHHTDLPVIVLLPEQAKKSADDWLKLGAKDAISYCSPEHVVQAAIRELKALADRGALRTHQQTLKETEQRCEQLLKHTSLAIAYVHEGAHVHANEAYLNIFGYSNNDDLAGEFLIDLISEVEKDDIKIALKKLKLPEADTSLQSTFQGRLKRSNGETFEANMVLSNAIFDDESCLQVIIHPVQSGKTRETQVISQTDMLQRLSEQPKGHSLVKLHLDNYDDIRAEFHAAGALAVQKEMTELIAKHLPDSQVAHYADEVFLATSSANSSESFQQLCKTINSHLVSAGEQSLHTSVSIGYSINRQEVSASQWFKEAETACSISRQEGGNRATRYSRQSVIKARANKGDKEAIIRQALAKDYFKLMYQPIVSLTGDGAESYEVLIRLKNPDGEDIPAAEFITTAEECGLTRDIDLWVLQHALQALAENHQFGADTRLMIHISAASVCNNSFSEQLSGLVKQAGIKGESLILQIAEQEAHQYLLQIQAMKKQLQPVGCKLCIARYTGDNKTLKALKYLKPDMVKLDGQFARQLERNRQEKLIETITPLSPLVSGIIMPQVESSKSLAQLWHLGVHYIQGNYLHSPMSEMTFEFNA